MALIESYARFDKSRGLKYSTFAYTSVYGMMMKHCYKEAGGRYIMKDKKQKFIMATKESLDTPVKNSDGEFFYYSDLLHNPKDELEIKSSEYRVEISNLFKKLRLSDRDVHIVYLKSIGYTYAQIASGLGITLQRIEQLIRRIHNRASILSSLEYVI